jgi:hypothetical protein
MLTGGVDDVLKARHEAGAGSDNVSVHPLNFGFRCCYLLDHVDRHGPRLVFQVHLCAIL